MSTPKRPRRAKAYPRVGVFGAQAGVAALVLFYTHTYEGDGSVAERSSGSATGTFFKVIPAA